MPEGPDGPDEATPPPPPPADSGGWAPPPPPSPGGGAGYGGPYRSPEIEGLAIGALIAAVAAWVICPIVPAIVALVLAANADRTIRDSGGWKTGAGLVTAARWLAWINIGVSAAVVLLVVVIAVAGAGS